MSRRIRAIHPLDPTTRKPLLFLAQRLPFPPNKGDKVRSFAVLRHLSRSWRVLLGCFVDDPDDLRHLEAVSELCAASCCIPIDRRWASLRASTAFLRGRSVSESWFADARLSRWVAGALAEHRPEAAFVSSSAMAQYLPVSGPLRPRRVVVDLVDADADKWSQYAERHRGWERWLFRRESRRLLAYEREVAGRADACVFCSESEAAIFRRLAPDRAQSVRVIPNGVDHASFAPQESGFARPFAVSDRAVVFTGAMDYWPNVDAVEWFAAEILPALRAALDQVRFVIVGANPTRQVRRLARRPDVIVTGRVPDVRPYLAHADVVVAPMRVAKGIQNKVLEGMAMGSVVVTTPGGGQGIDAEPGRHLLVAASASDFAAATLRALTDPGCAAIGRAARELVIERYGWDPSLRRFDGLLADQRRS